MSTQQHDHAPEPEHGHAPEHGHDHGSGHHAGHEPEHHAGFIRTYIFSTDHKTIGKQFLAVALLMMVLGGLLAMVVRWQLAWPFESIPLLGKITSQQYNMFFTMHATIMIFFVIIPLLTGAFGNFLIPLQIGARDMAFPFLNMLSFWFAIPGAICMLASFFVEGGAASFGWTSYPPGSNRMAPGMIASGPGQDLWLIALLFTGTGSIMGAVNYLTTIINLRAPGMTFFRMPLATWSLFITSILVLFATPVLTSALGMLLFDRNLGTNFFLNGPAYPGAEGQPLLWQHLFWFYSHPAVYIMILPAMGMASDVIATFARKPIFGYKAMVFAVAGIAVLGFIVWGHHMFQSGMNPTLGTTFMVSTMVIAVPSAIKVFNWLGTLWGGNIQFTTAMLHAITFVAMFVIGGLSGIFMASTPVDIFIHDTYFIVAHLHYVLFGGSLFGIFAGIYFWFPKMFGKMMNEPLGKVHWLLTFIFFNATFFPMHIVGAGGMMRRVANPAQYPFLADLQPWNKLMTMAALTLGLVQVLFFANLIWSLAKGKKAEQNPWKSNTLEWVAAPAHPGHGNFGPTLPIVYHGPYEYASPLVEADYLPQTLKVDEAAIAAARRAHGHG